MIAARLQTERNAAEEVPSFAQKDERIRLRVRKKSGKGIPCFGDIASRIYVRNRNDVAAGIEQYIECGVIRTDGREADSG